MCVIFCAHCSHTGTRTMVVLKHVIVADWYRFCFQAGMIQNVFKIIKGMHVTCVY
jgi:hypothetical protein